MSSIDIRQLPEHPQQVAERQALQQARTLHLTSAERQLAGVQELPDGLREQVRAYVQSSVSDAQRHEALVQAGLGRPQSVPMVDALGLRVYRGTSYAPRDEGMQAAAREHLGRLAEHVRTLETVAQAEAGRLAQAALAASAETPLPRGVSETRVAEIRDDLARLLEQQSDPQRRQSTAVDLIRQAVANRDDATLSVLLGPRMALVRQRLGIPEIVLHHALFEARMEHAQAQLDAANPQRVGAGTRAGVSESAHAPRLARFLERQLDPETALGAVKMHEARRLRLAHALGARHGDMVPSIR